LKNLLKARALMDDILQDECWTVPVALLYTKLDKLAAQVREFSKVQSQSQQATQIQNPISEPPHFTLDAGNATSVPVHAPHHHDVKTQSQSYADAAAATAHICPQALNMKNTSSDTNKDQCIATSQSPPTTAPSLTRDSKCIIM
jgi:hypothetical protein